MDNDREGAKTSTLNDAAPSVVDDARTHAGMLAAKTMLARVDALRARPTATTRARGGRRFGGRATVAPMALRNFDYPEALLFDCDGVLCETERDGHRVTFNKTFKEFGFDHEWDVETYGELLKIGGGKERMTHYFDGVPETEPWKSVTDPEARKELVKKLHLRKTEMFLELVNEGALPLRPGVKRMVGEALEHGAKVAVCSTSNEKAVQGIVNTMLPEFADRMPVFAGDIVPKKKPSPDIYNLAAETLGVDPARCVVVEDTHIGCSAAKAAGMRCIVTKSIYSEGEDFSRADHVVDCLGDEGDERVKFHQCTTPGDFWLNPPLPVDYDGNWYREDAGDDANDVGDDDDGLTPEERAILADIE